MSLWAKLRGISRQSSTKVSEMKLLAAKPPQSKPGAIKRSWQWLFGEPLILESVSTAQEIVDSEEEVVAPKKIFEDLSDSEKELLTSVKITEANLTTVDDIPKILTLLDQQIIQAWKSNIWLSQIAGLFELELEQIQDGNFFIMLAGWKQTYNSLKLRVDLLKKEIQTAGELLVKGQN